MAHPGSGVQSGPSVFASRCEDDALGSVAGGVECDVAADVLGANCVEHGFEVAAGEVLVVLEANITSDVVNRSQSHDVA